MPTEAVLAVAGEPVVEVASVEVRFPGVGRVLGPLSLRIRSGEHWALLGANGAGKSTLLSIIGARRFPSKGDVTILGSRLGRVDLRDLRTRIGVVDASLSVPSHLTVTAYVGTGLTQTVQPRWDGPVDAAVAGLVAGAVETVGLQGFSERLVASLSAGERARARVARALMAESSLMLLDEPAAGLDLPGRADLLATVERIARDRPHLTSVTVAHHLEELAATTTHVALLRNSGDGGQILASGPSELLGDADLLSRCFGRPLVTASVGGRWVAMAKADLR